MPFFILFIPYNHLSYYFWIFILSVSLSKGAKLHIVIKSYFLYGYILYHFLTHNVYLFIDRMNELIHAWIPLPMYRTINQHRSWGFSDWMFRFQLQDSSWHCLLYITEFPCDNGSHPNSCYYVSIPWKNVISTTTFPLYFTSHPVAFAQRFFFFPSTRWNS